MKKIFLFMLLGLSSLLCNAQFNSPILQDTLVLTPSEAANLNTTPKQIIPAPGTDQYIHVIQLISDIDLDTITDCCSGATMSAIYGSGGGKEAFNKIALNELEDEIEIGVPHAWNFGSSFTYPIFDIVNQPIYLQGSADFGEINETIKVYITYQIIDLTFSVSQPSGHPNIFTDTVFVSATQLATSGTFPITIVPSPGSDKILIVLFASSMVDFNSVAFGNIDLIQLKYSSNQNVWGQFTGLLKATEDKIITGGPINIPNYSLSSVQGASIILKNIGNPNNFSNTADSTVKIIVTYLVL